MDTIAEKFSIAEVMALLDDPDMSEAQLRPYLIIDESASDAFAPVLRFNPATVEVPPVPPGQRPRGGSFLRIFNQWARRSRQRRFNRKIRDGYQGPVIVSEGDSWFQYPILLDDVIDCLSNEFAVFSLGAAADTLQQMLNQNEFMDAIMDVDADVFLLSGGGNDLFGNRRLASYVKSFDATHPADEYLLPVFDGFLNDVLARYQQIIQRVIDEAPHVQIFCHAYDLAIPDAQQWLGKPLKSRGITDPSLQVAIVAQILERFSLGLQGIAARFDSVHFIDARGTVEDRWHDELHPDNAGFKDVSTVFGSAIEAVVASGVVEQARQSSGAAADEFSEVSNDESQADDAASEVSNVDTVTAPAILSSGGVGTVRGYSLHVGVNRIDPNHYGSDGALLACEFDAEAMLEVAKEAGYESSSLLLTADATRENLKAGIREVAARMTSNDIFFLSYAGHGAQLKDLNEDEDDGLDETWCLYDAQLSDDELYDLWATFPAGCRILVVSDSCHSGSVVRAGTSGLFTATPLETAPQTDNTPSPRALPPRQISRTYMRNRDFYDQTLSRSGTAESRGTIPVSVRLLSGCQDNQLSMDGPFNGAFTTQLLKVWDKGRYDNPYSRFQREIVRRMPETQTPVHLQTGVANAFFDQQRPFQI